MAHRHDDGSWRVLLFRRAIKPDLGKWSVVGGRLGLVGEHGKTTAR
jgi:ADP-ribose pyrophosphatase YjhB (NUDIX family)